MQELTDSELLRRYSDRASEEAFAVVVARHIDKVHSAALRHVGNLQDAEEITQAVFIILARQARTLLKHTSLAGWLYQTARFTAISFLRHEIRRSRHEQETRMLTTLDQCKTDTWKHIEPVLEDAIAALGAKDRQAIVLRFFDGKTLSEVAAALESSEEAAKKRVSRAVEKLHVFFGKRGIVSTTAIIAAALSTNAVQAAPAGLAGAVTAVAAAKGAAVSSSTLALIKGALKLMAWAKAKTAVAAGVILAAATTTGVVGYNLAQGHSPKPALFGVDADIQADGMIRMRATWEHINSSKKVLGTNDSITFNTFSKIERFTDETGRAFKFTEEPRNDGLVFKCTVTFNRTVPPGGRYCLAVEGTMDGLRAGKLKPVGEPGVIELQFPERPSWDYATQRKDIYRLPPGAILLENDPADMTVKTNGDRIEVRLEKVLPPPGNLDIRIRYRLASAAK